MRTIAVRDAHYVTQLWCVTSAYNKYSRFCAVISDQSSQDVRLISFSETARNICRHFIYVNSNIGQPTSTFSYS